jgi:hypothetical protein
MAKISLEQRIERLEAAREVQNVMSRYAYMHTAGLHRECVSLFTANQPDAKIEMMWGIYEGKDAAYRCYAIDHANLEGQGEIRRGRMQMHALTTPLIEVAGDAKTAKAVWIASGHESAAGKGKALANWAWCKYGADFMKEDGKWKIWHLRVYGIFMTDYNKPWTEVTGPIGSHNEFMELTPGVKLVPGEPPAFKFSVDRPSSGGWEYRPDALYPYDQPLPPQPYETWDDSMSYIK